MKGEKMKIGDKVAIVCCSNGISRTNKEQIENLKNILNKIGLLPVSSPYLYEKDGLFSGLGKERAEALMDFYRNEEIKAIYDISGGDIANEILPYLDFDIIAKQEKMFWGYSDLTTIINAIYARTGKKSVLYQIRNMLYSYSEIQQKNFANTTLNNTNDLFQFSYEFIQKNQMEGIVVGGNIRCLLKLAGTPYWPDMQNKILLLEARGGELPQMITYLNQLKQMGTFDRINGIILGTFTKLDEVAGEETIINLVKEYTGQEMPIIKTREIGHGMDSKAIIIGERKIYKK